MRDAIELKLVDEVGDFETIRGCDVIILTIPVDAIVETIKMLNGVSRDTTIIDLE